MGIEAVDQFAAVAACAYAMVLGGVIGYEREMKNRPAGFRTHMLVAGAAALLVGIGRVTLDDPLLARGDVRVDPLLLVEAVVAGVAFIGAGTIFGRRSGADPVAGITTAASLLTVAVIGVATGFRYFWLATSATVLAMVVLTAVNAVERRLTPRRRRDRGELPDSDADRGEGDRDR